ncbi:serine/threonine-protein kinase ULK3-like [Centruroides sculpturatus]|uniref:serine/threonine-protein kinase ULK3-like n=1 Tax=Centruroides sculpturatus TaxID=218467 RepID=UPI000C6C985F|nr:serine/threonine-protein kinase ULK3-like [Centruroides sculpturatus]
MRDAPCPNYVAKKPTLSFRRRCDIPKWKYGSKTGNEMTCLPQLTSFVFAEKLGRGSYATVYKAYRKGSKREVVAIKCVEKSSLNKTAVDNLITEISILKKVKNEYIVELKDFEWDDKYIYLIMEYCSGGDLSHFIRQRRRLPEVIVCRFLQQLATALKVLRSNNITHMDLKPQNILLSNNQDPVLKLADFGFAQYLNPEDRATSLRGSPLYMAPEILLKHHYDARVDLWSVGIILYECLFGQAPFSSDTFSQLADKIKSTKPIQIPYGVNISDNCRHLILSLLERDPNKRITFEDFFNHPFIDLKHMPSPESYQKGVKLIQEAILKDSYGDYNDAIQLYCEGLQYLVPLVTSEKDRRQKLIFQQKVGNMFNKIFKFILYRIMQITDIALTSNELLIYNTLKPLLYYEDKIQ